MRIPARQRNRWLHWGPNSSSKFTLQSGMPSQNFSFVTVIRLGTNGGKVRDGNKEGATEGKDLFGSRGPMGLPDVLLNPNDPLGLDGTLDPNGFSGLGGSLNKDGSVGPDGPLSPAIPLDTIVLLNSAVLGDSV